MIFLTYGTDKNLCRDKHQGLTKALLAKNNDSSVFKISGENFSESSLRELVSGQTLFAQKFIVSCDNLLKEKEAKEFILENLADIKSSNNIFLFLETEEQVTRQMSFDDKAKIEKRHKEIEELKKKAGKSQEFLAKLSPDGFNVYSLIDAFFARNKNHAWALYQEALMKNVAPEEILWKLIWQVNNLLVVKNTKDEKTLKLKPFVLTKTKLLARGFSNEELKKLSASFLDLYHTTFLGSEEFEFGLEKIILKA